MSTATALAAGVTVVAGAGAGSRLWTTSLPTRRLQPAAPRAEPDAGALPSSPPAVVVMVAAPVRWLGGALRTCIPHTMARADQPGDDLRWGLAALAGLALGALTHVVLAAAPIAGALAWPVLRDRAAARRREAAIVDQLPDVVDLLRLTTLAGLPVSTAVTAIGARPGGPVGAGLHHAADRLDRGATTAEALATLGARCGRPARPLVDALVDHDRYGTPLGPALDRLAVETRLRRRHQAEEAARRLPVTLLFPLVLTTLPACGLLTVVPLLVASLSSLQP